MWCCLLNDCIAPLLRRQIKDDAAPVVALAFRIRRVFDALELRTDRKTGVVKQAIDVLHQITVVTGNEQMTCVLALIFDKLQRTQRATSLFVEIFGKMAGFGDIFRAAEHIRPHVVMVVVVAVGHAVKITFLIFTADGFDFLGGRAEVPMDADGIAAGIRLGLDVENLTPVNVRVSSVLRLAAPSAWLDFAEPRRGINHG